VVVAVVAAVAVVFVSRRLTRVRLCPVCFEYCHTARYILT